MSCSRRRLVPPPPEVNSGLWRVLDALGAEDAAEFVDPLEAATISLRWSSWRSAGTAADRGLWWVGTAGVGAAGLGIIEHGGFDLQKFALIEPAADAADELGAARKGSPGLGRGHQIEIGAAGSAISTSARPIAICPGFSGCSALESISQRFHLHRTVRPCRDGPQTAHAPDRSRGIPNQEVSGRASGLVPAARGEGGLNEQLDGAAFIPPGERRRALPTPAGSSPARPLPSLGESRILAIGQIGHGPACKSALRCVGFEAQGIGGPWPMAAKASSFSRRPSPGGSNAAQAREEGAGCSLHPAGTACTGVGPRPFSPDLGGGGPPGSPVRWRNSRCRARWDQLGVAGGTVRACRAGGAT